MKMVFLSHLDLNLYLFRLPIMEALVKENWDVYVIASGREYLNKFSKHGIIALKYWSKL